MSAVLRTICGPATVRPASGSHLDRWPERVWTSALEPPALSNTLTENRKVGGSTPPLATPETAGHSLVTCGFVILGESVMPLGLGTESP